MSPLLIKSKQDRIDRIEATTISARIDRREIRERFESRKIRGKNQTPTGSRLQAARGARAAASKPPAKSAGAATSALVG
jgi:hypothetical protein